MQYLTKNTGYAFVGVEKILQETFLPCFFFVKSKSLPSIVGTLSMVLVKKSGLGLQNSVTSADEKPLSLQHLRTELIRYMKGESKFSAADYLQVVKEERSGGRKTQDDVNTAEL